MVATSAIIISSAANEYLALVAKRLVEPATKIIAVCIKEYRAFIPSKQGVTIRLLIIDWKTMDAPPIENETIIITKHNSVENRNKSTKY